MVLVPAMDSSSLSSSSGVPTERAWRVGDGALRHAGEHAARAELDEVGHARIGEGEEAVLPAHGAGQLRREQARPLVALVVGEGVDVGDDRHLGVARLRVGDRLAQPVARRRHERRVERPGHRERHHLLRAELLGVRSGGRDSLGRPGDHDLAGSVEVGDPHVAVGAAAGDLDLVVVEAEDRGHRAGLILPGVVHGLGALGDEAHALVEARRAGGDERGVLAEAVAGAEHRVEAEALDRVEHHQARHERGELGVAGVLQLVGVGVEQQSRDVTFGDLARFLDELPGLLLDPRPPHAGALRALAGERECEHQWRHSSGSKQRGGSRCVVSVTSLRRWKFLRLRGYRPVTCE